MTASTARRHWLAARYEAEQRARGELSTERALKWWRSWPSHEREVVVACLREDAGFCREAGDTAMAIALEGAAAMLACRRRPSSRRWDGARLEVRERLLQGLGATVWELRETGEFELAEAFERAGALLRAFGK